MLHTIPPSQVTAGMYVRKFGGSWLDHPFWFSRFVVTPEDVARINEARIPHVVIDDEKGVGPVKPASSAREPALPPPPAVVRPKPARPDASTVSRLRGPVIEPWRRTSDRERAQALVSESLATMRRACSDVRLGRAVRMREVRSLVDEVVEMVERCPRTLLDILRLKKKDEYTYLHSVAVCTLMINVARHLGRSEEEVRDYGMAGLLHDIGKMGVDDTILNKPGALSDDEMERVRRHPEFGHAMLLKTANVPELALDVCLHHHERIDGKGYPHKLAGDELTEAVRLGAICDVYDALTSDRVYKGAWTPVEAVAAMWRWHGQFDRELLLAFMQAMGIFPPGVLVELRSSRLGLVLDNAKRSSRPRLLAFFCLQSRSRIEPEEIAIDDDFANEAIMGIVTPEQFGLTMQECREDAIREAWGEPVSKASSG